MAIVSTVATATKGMTVSSSVIAIDNAGFSWGTNDLVNAQKAVITARTNGVMVTYSGEDPTATLGHFLAANDNMVVYGNDNINNLKFLREADADAELSITLEV